MSGATQHDDEVLVGYVSRALEMRERGEELRLEVLCRAHPELIEHVADMLSRAPQLTGLAKSAQEFDGLEGRVLQGRYRLDARLGAGAMGIVYGGFDLELGRAVAVKVLRPELFGGQEAEKRFLREAELLAALRHPNVVAVFDRGCTNDGVSFLVMELLHGQPLVALLAEHQRRVETGASAALDDVGFVAPLMDAGCELEGTWLRQAVRWTADLAQGLGEAHRLGILHRDVKPSNIFIASNGQARLLDFGVAADTNHATLAANSNSTLGTPGYMAPEAVTEHAPATPAVDIYGLAATLYHLLTRRPPYLGTVTHIIASVQRRDPIPVGRLRPGLPRDLHAIVDRALARRVSDRYASMAEFAGDLTAFLNHQPVQARPLSAVDRVWRRARRSPSARVAAGIVATLVVAGLVYEWQRFAQRRVQSNYLDVIAQLPPGLTVEPAAYRAIANDAERADLRRLLDAAVQYAAEPLPARLLRAAFLLDQGHASAAADDMAVIAGFERSAFSVQLAERYREAATRGGAGYQAVELSNLPEPASLHDRYLLAYHVLRAGPTRASNDQAIQWFEDADPNWLPAQEMLASALNFRARLLRKEDQDPEAAMRSSCRALEIAVGIETRRGRRTVTTAQHIGAALLGQQRFAEAKAVLAAASTLSPWSMGVLLNLASAQRRLGDLAGAITTCERAMRLRLRTIESYEILASTYVDLGDFARSRAIIDSAPVPAGAAGGRHRLKGFNEYSIALVQRASAHYELARAAASKAVEHFEAAGDSARVEAHVSAAIALGDYEALVLALIELWQDDPTSWVTTANLVDITAPLSQEAVALLCAGMRKLAQSQSPPRPISSSSPNPLNNPQTLETAK